MASNCIDGESVKARITQLMVTLGRPLAADEIYLKFQSTFHDDISLSSVGCSTLEELLRSMDNVCLDLLLSEPFGGRSYFKLKENAVSFERPPTPTECDAASISPAQRLRQLTAAGGTGISMQELVAELKTLFSDFSFHDVLKLVSDDNRLFTSYAGDRKIVVYMKKETNACATNSDEGQATSGVDDLLGDCQTLISHYPAGIRLLDFPQKFEEFFGRPIPLDGVPLQGFDELWHRVKLLPSVEYRLSETYGEPMFTRRLDGGGDSVAAFDSDEVEVQAPKTLEDLTFGHRFDRLFGISVTDLLTWSQNDYRRNVEIVFTQFVAPDLFHAINKRDYDPLVDLHQKMELYYRNGNGRSRQMCRLDATVDAFCALDYDGQFHRSKILEVDDGDYAKVLYIDFGTEEQVELDKLFYLDEEFVDLPQLSFLFRINDMNPLRSKEWSLSVLQLVKSQCHRILEKNEQFLGAKLLVCNEEVPALVAEISCLVKGKTKLLTEHYLDVGLPIRTSLLQPLVEPDLEEELDDVHLSQADLEVAQFNNSVENDHSTTNEGGLAAASVEERRSPSVSPDVVEPMREALQSGALSAANVQSVITSLEEELSRLKTSLTDAACDVSKSGKSAVATFLKKMTKIAQEIARYKSLVAEFGTATAATTEDEVVAVNDPITYQTPTSSAYNQMRISSDYYQTPISSAHYQSPTSSAHYQTPTNSATPFYRPMMHYQQQQMTPFGYGGPPMPQCYGPPPMFANVPSNAPLYQHASQQICYNIINNPPPAFRHPLPTHFSQPQMMNPYATADVSVAPDLPPQSSFLRQPYDQ